MYFSLPEFFIASLLFSIFCVVSLSAPWMMSVPDLCLTLTKLISLCVYWAAQKASQSEGITSTEISNRILQGIKSLIPTDTDNKEENVNKVIDKFHFHHFCYILILYRCFSNYLSLSANDYIIMHTYTHYTLGWDMEEYLLLQLRL